MGSPQDRRCSTKRQGKNVICALFISAARARGRINTAGRLVVPIDFLSMNDSLRSNDNDF
jgi:hypothetical protein